MANKVIQLKDGSDNLFPVSSVVRIDNPFESLDDSKCLLYDGDNFIYVSRDMKLVYFSIRFVMKVATTGNLAVMKFKTAYDAYKPVMWNNQNGGIYYAKKTWNNDPGLLLYMSSTFQIGVSAGAVANQGYIVQGMYFIA